MKPDLRTFKGRKIIYDYSDDIKKHVEDPSSKFTEACRDTYDYKLYDHWLEGQQLDTIIDFGANVGVASLYFADSAKRIIAIEPTPGHCNVLRQLCKNEPHIEIVQAALTDKDGDVPFNLSIDNSASNSIIARQQGDEKGVINVRGMTLETLLNEYNVDKVDWCKMDIEGSEMIALTVDTLKPVFDKIDNLFIEVHHTEWPWRKSYQSNVIKLVKILSEVGYVCDSPYIDCTVTSDHMVAMRESCKYRQFLPPVQHPLLHDSMADKIFCSKKTPKGTSI